MLINALKRYINEVESEKRDNRFETKLMTDKKNEMEGAIQELAKNSTREANVKQVSVSIFGFNLFRARLSEDVSINLYYIQTVLEEMTWLCR